MVNSGFGYPRWRVLLACHVLWRELSVLTACSRFSWRVEFLKRELHETPRLLHSRLQDAIDLVEADLGDEGLLNSAVPFSTEGQVPEAIVLGYGLCSRALEGLCSRRIPLVAARAHDCVALQLGGRERYGSFFSAHPGTFWFSSGWAETTMFPSHCELEAYRQVLSRKYDDADDVDYLMDCQTEWIGRYSHGAWINSRFSPENDRLRERVMSVCREVGWGYFSVDYCDGLLRRLLDASLDGGDDDIVIARPGQTFVFTGDDDVIGVCDK
ncbi:DUF1638 domain-containing protein [Candidatus Sumerlaeota bacterium]|nr:DUF1638 domain-containing protein [Candidatus Sumerlaeales bacterium]NLD62219.1 DUF1638 domain-containing protein [Candidatus Sumerlaeota bacterium]